MSLPIKSSRGFVAVAATALSLALLVPANAQFWDWGGGGRGGDWGGWGRQRQQRDQFWSPFESRPQRERYEPRDAPIDYSRAPAPAQKKPEATTNIVVLGDAMADWLALGLEEAFAEKPEIGVARKHRTDSGLIRYDHRRDVEWAQVVKEVIAAEKPKFIVMMVGNNDRQSIRERAPVAARPGAPKPAPGQTAQQQTPPAPAGTATPPAAQPDPEQQVPEGTPEPPAAPTPEQIRAGALGPWEFHTEKWEAAYIRRIDATIAALKSAGVPVIWVGLPSQRGTKASSDSSYLNELYRSRAEKAAITYVDIWDGFVDESGRYAPQGPDFEGQTRRLRSGDGVYFTKFGARKLAHYVEREVQRHITNRAIPVALPVPVEPGTPAAKPGGPAQRPAVGPVVPLTAAASTATEELVGGGPGRTAARPATPASPDPVAARVLTKGEPIAPPTGRADDFSWPRGSAPVEPVALQPTPASPAPANASPSTGAPPAGATAQSKAGQQGNEARPQQQRRRAPDGPRQQQFQGFGFFRW